MTYDEAMAVIHRKPKHRVTREAAPQVVVTWRFGKLVMLGPDPSYVDYLPPRRDIEATDWMEIPER